MPRMNEKLFTSAPCWKAWGRCFQSAATFQNLQIRFKAQLENLCSFTLRQRQFQSQHLQPFSHTSTLHVHLRVHAPTKEKNNAYPRRIFRNLYLYAHLHIGGSHVTPLCIQGITPAPSEAGEKVLKGWLGLCCST